MGRRVDRDEVLARTDLAGLLDELCGPREGSGHRARWHCPMPDHPDEHPSVTVSQDRRGTQRWHCWSQGHSGTAIDALVAGRGMSVGDAFEELAQRSGVVGDRPLARRVTRSEPPPRFTRLAAAVLGYVAICESTLFEPAGQRVLEYLVDVRGLDSDVLRANRVGADPGNLRMSRQAGLTKGAPRAVFPALDHERQVTYFQARPIDTIPGRPKYLNPSGEYGRNPGHGWTVPGRGGDAEPIVICEGFPDAYIANSAGYTAVAVLGTGNATDALAERLAPRLRGRPVLLALDGDDAGRLATQHLRVGFERCGIMVVEFPLPPGTDLNSWVQSARQVPDLGRSARPIAQQPIAVAPAPVLAPAPVIPGP
jgi:DNA primase